MVKGGTFRNAVILLPNLKNLKHQIELPLIMWEPYVYQGYRDKPRFPSVSLHNNMDLWQCCLAINVFPFS